MQDTPRTPIPGDRGRARGAPLLLHRLFLPSVARTRQHSLAPFLRALSAPLRLCGEEVIPRSGRIPIHLRHQAIDVGELLFVAQLFQEAHSDAPPVQACVEIEQMHFQCRTAPHLDCRPYTEACHARHRPVAQPVHLYDKYPRQRRLGPLQLHVRRGIAYLCAELVAVHDPAGNRIRPSEQLPSPAKIALLQPGTDYGAGNTLASHHHARHCFNLESGRGSTRLEEAEISRAPRTKTEIIPDQQPPYRQAVLQYPGDEFACGQLCECIVETTHVRPVNAAVAQDGQFFVQRRQSRRRLIGREKFLRLRLEGHDRDWQGGRACHFRQARDHCPVPEMDAVEVADGKRDGNVRPRRDAAEYSHVRPTKSPDSSGFRLGGARFSTRATLRSQPTLEKCWASAQSAIAFVRSSESPMAGVTSIRTAR